MEHDVALVTLQYMYVLTQARPAKKLVWCFWGHAPINLTNFEVKFRRRVLR